MPEEKGTPVRRDKRIFPIRPIASRDGRWTRGAATSGGQVGRAPVEDSTVRPVGAIARKRHGGICIGDVSHRCVSLPQPVRAQQRAYVVATPEAQAFGLGTRMLG